MQMQIFSNISPLPPTSPLLSYHSILPTTNTPLVLRSSLLARLQLIQIPPANRQAALVIVHALAEVVDVGLARAALVRLLRLLVLLSEVGVLRGLLGGWCG